MCFLVFSFQQSREVPFLMFAHRDEFHHRRAASLHRWPPPWNCVGGKDEVKGGSWLACREDGRFAALTNLPGGGGDFSRGWLVRDFFSSSLSLLAYLQSSVFKAKNFNLLVGELPGKLFGYSSLQNLFYSFPPGVFLVENLPLGRVSSRGKRILSLLSSLFQEPAREGILEEGLEILRDRRPTDHGSPKPYLTAPFIVHPVYGTRSGAALRLFSTGELEILEWTYGRSGEKTKETRQVLSLHKKSTGISRAPMGDAGLEPATSTLSG